MKMMLLKIKSYKMAKRECFFHFICKFIIVIRNLAPKRQVEKIKKQTPESFPSHENKKFAIRNPPRTPPETKM